MAITRIPEEPTKAISVIDEKKAEAFISGAKKTIKKGMSRAVVNMKFDIALLEKIDEAATQRGFSRTAWVHYAASEILKRGME